MSDAVSPASTPVSGSQADVPRTAEPSSNYRNSPSFSQVLRAGVKEPRGPQASAAPADKQFLTSGAGSPPEASQESGAAPGARHPALKDLEERNVGERHGADDRERSTAACEWFDPLVRSLASQPHRPAPAPAAAPGALPVPELEQLLRDLVRRAAWGGDRRRGTARIELAAGELAGATLLVEADAHDLRIDLELPAGVAAEPWRQRLASRLSERGFAVSELNVY